MSGGAGAGGRRWRLVRASSDAVPASLRRLMRRRLAIRRNRRLPGGRRGLVTLVAGVVAMVGLVGWVLAGSTALAVREVRVTGTELVAVAQVREVAAVPDGTPLVRVDRAAVAARVAQLPAVASATVHRSWPRTLVVRVTERTPVGAVAVGEGYQLIDADGVVFHELGQRPADVPMVQLAAPGPDDPETRAALEVLTTLTPELHRDLAELVVAGPARITLELRSGYTVVWGDETDSVEKARVATALLAAGEVTGAGGDEQVIDVSSPEVVVLR